ncbi:MAG: T9SS type A sorting domain-containing protein [Ignavibacteriales bacterium]|nr:T9SS type A sorting domain-containing protein [Ignavibacteriales bacterium]
MNDLIKIKNLKSFLVLFIFSLCSLQLLAQSDVRFFNLGFGGGAKVSNNGTYVVGSNYPAAGFIWSEAAGRVSLGNTYSEAFGVSNNGRVAGSFIDSNLIAPNGNPTLRAGYYDSLKWMPLDGYPGYPVLDETSYNYGYGISADGSIIVGMQWLPIYKTEACYWDSAGLHMLGRTGGLSSNALDVANVSNGLKIVGWDGLLNGPGRRAFYWDPTPHFMGGYDSSYPDGQCFGLNSDGTKIVGGSTGALFVWTEGQGMNWFNTSYLNSGSYAKDISDNDIIVGYVDVGGFNYQAFIKRPEWDDILLLQDYLIDSLGVTEAADWLSSFANSISADGLTITGTAYPASGGPIAYVLKFANSVPVELSSFTATTDNQVVNLSWSTATELNNSGFEIQRVNQNSTWIPIGFINGNGTTANKNDYNFIDQNPLAGINKYRLKQVDFDGSFEYSHEVEVEIVPQKYILNQNYPNPFNPETKINFSISKEEFVKVRVFNSLGEEVEILFSGQLNAGSHTLIFNAENYASGLYILKLTAGSFSQTIKINLMK